MPLRDAPPEGDELLNLKQVARSLDVHYMTAYRYVRQGKLPARQAMNPSGRTRAAPVLVTQYLRCH
jgi:predicted site-specific integrase-resolvase